MVNSSQSPTICRYFGVESLAAALVAAACDSMSNKPSLGPCLNPRHADHPFNRLSIHLRMRSSILIKLFSYGVFQSKCKCEGSPSKGSVHFPVCLWGAAGVPDFRPWNHSRTCDAGPSPNTDYPRLNPNSREPQSRPEHKSHPRRS